MPSSISVQLPPPANWQDFELLCWNLWRHLWNYPETQRNGRQGQPQAGVDVSGRPNQGSNWAGIQCKLKDTRTGATLTAQELQDEVKKAKTFIPALTTYIIATTAPNDAVIQATARQITDAHRAEGLFSVDVLSWDEICARLADHPHLYARHFPQFVIGRLVEHINALPTDYAARIRNFLAEYLDSNRKPVPFGGRDTDLTGLDSWLDDPAAPPYRLLTGPAGRGKSALLVRWASRLQARSDIGVIFIPISIRFRTNLAGVIFPALAARLAAFHSEAVPRHADGAPELWRGIVADYLARPIPDGRRLLVILDGLDEAADWQAAADLFPLAPQAGLKTVVSARPLPEDTDGRAWLRRLGWEGRDLAALAGLDPLDRAGVAQILERMGCPLDELGRRIDIVGELHRLSEGDPLLIRLYVDDLWRQGSEAARLRPEQLRNLPPGLEGYFRQWWDDQRQLWGNASPHNERKVRSIFELLACALGPLTADDLVELAPPDLELSGWDIDEVLPALSRLIIGDGKVQGFTFSHPRLGFHFRDNVLTSQDRENTTERFINWGWHIFDALRNSRLAPERAPAYVVQHFGLHLEQSDNATPEALLALVDEAWHKAWHSLEGAYAGFLADVDRAWQAAEAANRRALQAGGQPSFLSAEILCALCRASIRGR